MTAKALSDCGVVVLGGTAGVGFEAAARFAEEGARVVIIGRHSERGATACEKLRERASGWVQFVKADASLPEDAVRAAEQAQACSVQSMSCCAPPVPASRLGCFTIFRSKTSSRGWKKSFFHRFT